MLIRQIWSLFNHRERWQVGLLSVALIIRAGIEMVGVASIMPFMSVVADPTMVDTNAFLAAAYQWGGFESVNQFIVALGVAVIAFLILANGFSALAVYGMTRFSWGMHHRLGTRLMRGYLAMPYGFFIQRNSASFSKTLLTECQQVIQGVLKPILNVIAKLLVVVAIAGLLIAIEPVLALVVVVLIGGSYGILYMLVRNKQRQLGIERVRANQQRYKASNEAFGGIKDVKVLQREGAFLRRFVPASLRYSKTTAHNQVIAQLPRYIFEVIAFGGVVAIVLYYLGAGQGIAQIMPVLSLYAFAGYRLMPELQQLFAAAALIRFNHGALDDLTADLAAVENRQTLYRAADALPFDDVIVLEDVSFTYPGAESPALDGVILRIEKNQTVGLVGESGSGKSTLVDLLLGLFEPDGGHILVDGVPLDESTIGVWRRQAGYVPQHIFLTDDTIAANIAFGVPAEEIDPALVERAARIAHLHEFITSLPNAYDTVVGERGVRLSGGQRQRIGIARALHHDPEVLVMDEATSALDGATESSVMEAIRDLAGRKTIILIAHRLSTVQDCDCIYLLENGRVADKGTYSELVTGSTGFQSMAKQHAPAASKSVV